MSGKTSPALRARHLELLEVETMSEATTRFEHLAWCKGRAMEYADCGDLKNAFASFASDVRKHPETEDISGVISNLGLPLLLGGFLDTPQKMREHIEEYT